MFNRGIFSVGLLLSCLFWLGEAMSEPDGGPSAQSENFQRLEDAMNFYDELARSGQWFPLPDGPLLRLGDQHEQVAQLRQQLYLLGDYREDNNSTLPEDIFDEPLSRALLRFQQRHSAAKVDGILGNETRRLLNIPPWIRSDQLLLNISRQEQFFAVVGPRYVQVNIPEYRLKLFDDGLLLLDMKAIVGRQSRQTPVFSSVVRSLVVNPAWSVPRSIAMKDILPKWKRDKAYLVKQDLQVISGWEVPVVMVANDAVDPSKMYRGLEYYRFWQPPGPKNALGRIKFEVPNSDSIYLHDTQTRHLFAVNRRAFSSGCIRLEKPMELAEQLMILANAAQPSDLSVLLDTSHTRNILLNSPVEMHVTYWTAWLDEKGILYFGDDLYQRDTAILAEMEIRQARAY